MKNESRNSNRSKIYVKAVRMVSETCALIMSFVLLLLSFAGHSYAKGNGTIIDSGLSLRNEPLASQMINPVTTVSTKLGSANFEYDSKNNLIKKIENESIVEFSEKDGRITSVKSPNYSYRLIYDCTSDEDVCVGILIDGKYYTYEYENGNVS